LLVCATFSFANEVLAKANVNKLKHNTSKDFIRLEAIGISKFAAKIGINLLKRQNI
jgi:hypothetical protein